MGDTEPIATFGKLFHISKLPEMKNSLQLFYEGIYSLYKTVLTILAVNKEMIIA